MISIEVPVHSYIKTCLPLYMKNDVAEMDSLPGRMLISYLNNDTNERKCMIRPGTYQETVFITVTPRLVRRLKNASIVAIREKYILNETQAQHFNSYMRSLIKNQIRSHLITYLYFDASITRAIKYVREIMSLPEREYSDDAIIKDLQRFREEQKNRGNTKLSYMYINKKNPAQKVLFE